MSDLVTVDAIMAARPCEEYTRERVEEIVGDGLTPQQITALDIPAEERLWTLIHVVLDDRQRRLLACDCAERSLAREREAGRDPDDRSWEAVAVARRYARGEATEEALAAARADVYAAYAVRAAAYAAYAVRAAAYVAWDAAGAAAWDAVRAAAYVAWDAAYAAAGVDAGAAAWDAEREWQVTRALENVGE